MKRLFLVFALLASLTLIAGTASAANTKWYGQNTSATITDVVWNAIGGNTSATKPKTVNGEAGYGQYNWGNGLKAQADTHSVDKNFDLDLRNVAGYGYYGYELNYLHMDFDTAKLGVSGNQIAPTKITTYIATDFSYGGYASSKNPVRDTLGASIDFYYKETAQGTLVYMVDYFVKLGSINYGGDDYYFYAVADATYMQKTKLTGALYDEALADLGAAAGTPLYGWYVKAGGHIHFKFDIVVTDKDMAPAAVPVPAAAWLMGTGIAGLVALRRRNSK